MPGSRKYGTAGYLGPVDLLIRNRFPQSFSGFLFLHRLLSVAVHSMTCEVRCSRVKPPHGAVRIDT